MEIKIKKEEFEKGKLVEVSKSPKIIVYFDGEKFFAFSGICPHAKWPLELGAVKNSTLTCAGHGWEFKITNGECVSNPGRDLQTYDVQENSDEILITSEK